MRESVGFRNELAHPPAVFMSGLVVALLLGVTVPPSVRAQLPLGSSFTYQGRLTSGGVPSTGAFDMRFTLHDAPSGGALIGSLITHSGVAVSGGLFAVSLDFGATAFSGSARWLEIAVSFAGAGDYTTLSPRQELTSTPGAMWATKTGDAATLGGLAPSGFVLTGSVIQVAHGGSGATTAADARATLQTARSGANADITSLNSLTTPLGASQGGTGAPTAAGARTTLNAQTRITGACLDGQYLRTINSDGTAVCGADADTNSGGTIQSVTAGPGLLGGTITTAGTLSIAPGGVTSSLIANGAVGLAQIDASQVQTRIAGLCPVGQLLSGVNADGSLQCFDLANLPASVVNVTAGVPDGAYAAGASLPIVVLFSRPVAVVGDPTLVLETGSSDAAAVYSFGPSTNILVFTYTVAAGHSTPDLDYLSATALALNGGAINVSGGSAADLTLPAPGSAGSISANRNIVIDGIGPTVSNVTSTVANGSYTTGAVIDVRVTFSEIMTVTGVPQLTLETGASDAVVNYISGSGTNTLVFSYTVGPPHSSPDLDYASTGALAPNGGTIRDAAGNDAALTLPAPGTAGSLGANKDVVILPDTVAPTVSNVTSSAANGAYGIGAVIPVQVVFSEPVFVTGTPRLTLETGVADALVSYTSGSGSNTLVFSYTAAAGHDSSDLDYAFSSALALSGGTIRDGVANDAVLTLPAPGAAGSLGANKGIVIDGVAPTASSVTSSASNGTYGIGAIVPIQVAFSEPVFVTGTPRLTLETGAADALVSYTSGSGSSTLVFSYTVVAGHVSSDLDYLTTSALALNGGTIRDGVGNNAVLTLPAPGATGSLGANKGIVIDGVAPTVSNVTSPLANGTYGPGTTVPIQVTFSEVVTVTGTPQFNLAVAGPSAVANYSGGSGTSTLVFDYVVASGQSTPDLEYAPGALMLAGGTIRDAASNNASLLLPAPGATGSLGFNKNIAIDGVAPTVTNVTSSAANGSYGVGQLIPIQVTFSEPVVVTGTPRLTLETGTLDAVADFSAGSGTNTLVFNYSVLAGHASGDLDYASTTSLALNLGTIRDAVANNATLTLPSPGLPGSLGANRDILIDTTKPTVLDVTSPMPNGNYGVGAIIPILVLFSEPVVVTGSPLLTLETGPIDAVVSYSSGSGLAMLVFNYTVGPGQATPDLEYASALALTLGVATIRDAAGNNAEVMLPLPGTPGSLGFNKNIVIP